MPRTASTLAAIAALALGACQQAGPAELDAEALDAVALAVEDQMNEPAAAIMASLRAAGQEAQVGWDSLFINLTGEPEPVNWWFYRRGFLEMSGAQFATRAAFTLTKSAQELLAQPDEPWFEAEISGDPEVDCRTPAAMAANGCEVEVQVTPVLTAAGRAAVGAPAVPLQPLSVTAVVTLGPEDWEITGLATEGQTPADIALAAVLGTPEVRQAAARAANDQVNGRLAQLAGEREPEVNLDAWTPPNYVEPPPPVAPVQSPPPSGRPSSPFRPGT